MLTDTRYARRGAPCLQLRLFDLLHRLSRLHLVCQSTNGARGAKLYLAHNLLQGRKFPLSP